MRSNARTISEEEEAGYNTTKLQQGSMAVLMTHEWCRVRIIGASSASKTENKIKHEY